MLKSLHVPLVTITMLDTFAIIFPLIFIAGVGFTCAKLRFLNGEQLSGISRFIFYISIPVFLFINMAQAQLSSVLSLELMLSFYIPVVLIFTLMLILYKSYCGDWAQGAVLALGASYSNTVLIGLPIAIQALGKDIAATVFVLITFHSALLFLLTYAFSGRSQRVSWLTTVRQLVFNPVIMAISLGLLFNLSGLALPKPLESGLALLAEPAIAGALFVLGANLHHYQIRPGLHLALMLSVSKLLLLPALVWLLASQIFTLPQPQVLLVVLLSASPLGVNAYLVAKQLDTRSEVLASTVVLSTLLSIISFFFWLTLV
ncbi:MULTISPECIES: AEC family transporter [unclassified Pseudoalteromonas]|uniref:AEC family transporter n=1 Tax=unclassified Pseudoalteromonas TaxID=194690 RepID=UPI001F21EDF7|nr:MULTISPECIES: AEC family transporter [unclassified Pseudoalteromonas]